jgi:hypothetical protein
MPVDYTALRKSLVTRASDHASHNGDQLLREMDEATSLLLSWIQYLMGATTSESPKVLLRGVQAAAIEAAGCVALGLVRPALFSMRGQIDMMMAWMYFRDHAVEWRYTQNNAGEGKLRGEVTKYLGQYIPRYKERYKLLQEKMSRRVEEPYNLLSAHVHSLTPPTVPTLTSLSSLVCGVAVCRECVCVQSDVTEYLNDVCLATYVGNWADLPENVRTAANARLSSAQLKDLTKD